jgi:hypothetical protein
MMNLTSIYIFFAAGLFLSFVGWIIFGLIRNTFLRVLLRTGFVSLLVAPSFIGGDGFAPAPAFLIMVRDGQFLLGIVPILVTWIVSFGIIISIPRVRHMRTEWPIDSISVLILRPYAKLLLYGLIFCLLILGFYGYISDLWYVGALVLFTGMMINYFLCLHSFRLAHKGRFFIPLLFSAPAGLAGMYIIALPSYLSGLAGEMVAEGKKKNALRLTAVTSYLFFAVALRRLISAVKYQDVSRVKIQGGVTLAAITLVFILILSILVSILAWKSKPE